jgi:hypothetical protein
MEKLRDQELSAALYRFCGARVIAKESVKVTN